MTLGESYVLLALGVIALGGIQVNHINLFFSPDMYSVNVQMFIPQASEAQHCHTTRMKLKAHSHSHRIETRELNGENYQIIIKTKIIYLNCL